MIRPLYIVGDVHGQLGLLHAALDLIEADGVPGAPVVLVGDLVDRGSHSRAVIELLMSEPMPGRELNVLKGNHDRLFVNFWRDGALNDGVLRPGMTWLHPRMGGRDTLASYDVDVRDGMEIDDILTATSKAVPKAHIDWLATRPLTYETSVHFLAHAGIRPAVSLQCQTEDDLLWIRSEFHDDPGPHPKIIVHGHTPVERPVNYGHRINVDGGAGFGRPIFPVVLEEGQVFLLTSKGRVLLQA